MGGRGGELTGAGREECWTEEEGGDAETAGAARSGREARGGCRSLSSSAGARSPAGAFLQRRSYAAGVVGSGPPPRRRAHRVIKMEDGESGAEDARPPPPAEAEAGLLWDEGGGRVQGKTQQRRSGKRCEVSPQGWGAPKAARLEGKNIKETVVDVASVEGWTKGEEKRGELSTV